MEHKTFEKFVQNEPEWFVQHRREAFLAIEDAPDMQFKHGLKVFIKPDFDFSAIQPVAQPRVTKVIQTEVKYYSSHFLEKDLFVGEHAERVQRFLGDEWKKQKNKVTLFNQAFANDFLLIHIPRNTELSKPIQISYNIEKDPVISRIFVLAEPGSRAHIVLHIAGGTGYLSNDIRVIAETGSKISITTVQNTSQDVVTIQERCAITKKDAEVHWVELCVGSIYAKTEVVSHLIEPGAATTITALYIGQGNQKYDLYTAALHEAPHTKSHILTRGTLNHHAKALSRGLVKIAREASGSTGYEKQDALLLSKNAEADAIPNLEIYNKDVKCSHGSTIGQIDADKLFYAMSKGMDEETAKKKIIEGYFTPTLAVFSDSVREQIQKQIIEAIQ